MSETGSTGAGSGAWWFGREQERARSNARRALELAQQEIESVLKRWESVSPLDIARCARRVVEYGAEAREEGGALKALANTGHLVPGVTEAPAPDAERMARAERADYTD